MRAESARGKPSANVWSAEARQERKQSSRALPGSYTSTLFQPPLKKDGLEWPSDVRSKSRECGSWCQVALAMSQQETPKQEEIWTITGFPLGSISQASLHKGQIGGSKATARAPEGWVPLVDYSDPNDWSVAQLAPRGSHVLKPTEWSGGPLKEQGENRLNKDYFVAVGSDLPKDEVQGKKSRRGTTRISLKRHTRSKRGADDPLDRGGAEKVKVFKNSHFLRNVNNSLNREAERDIPLLLPLNGSYMGERSAGTHRNGTFRPSAVKNPFYPLTEESYGAYAVMCLSIVIFGIGIMGNMAVMCIVCHNYYMRSISNSLLANLAFWDFLIIFFCLPLVIFQELTKKWLLEDFSCKIVPYIEVSSIA
ncbi:UNVERIFIED_CONTAM: hypothetical protein K2H54_061155 [Gekko kuhli]